MVKATKYKCNANNWRVQNMSGDTLLNSVERKTFVQNAEISFKVLKMKNTNENHIMFCLTNIQNSVMNFRQKSIPNCFFASNNLYQSYFYSQLFK